MHRMILAGASLWLAVFAAPLQAQQTNTPATETPSSVAPLPPPFPPMPSSRPSHRWVDVGGHSRTRAHHKASPSHRASDRQVRRSRTHERLGAHERARSRERTHNHERGRARDRDHHRSHDETARLSTRQIRRCHGMSYAQIMKHSDCKTLMRQELGASEHRRDHGSRSKKTIRVHRHHVRKHAHSARHHRK